MNPEPGELARRGTYDAASNSIVFTATTTPGAGETLTVTSATVCF